MKRVAIYCRVSTAEQGKQETIQTQLTKLKEKYQSPVAEYKDVCSGAYLQREGLNQLRKDAKKGLFNRVAVYSLDRLSRKLGHQIALLEELEEQGVKIEVLGENYENTPEGLLNRNIRGAFAEYERYKIAKRSLDAKMRMVESGRLIGCYPPYGYTLCKRTEHRDAYFKINPQEAKIVRLIFKIYIETNSISQTTKQLYALGIRPRGRGEKKPTAFHKVTIRKILKNETYIGNFYYNKYQRCEAKKHIKENRKTQISSKKLRPKSEWKLIKVKSLVDEKVFNRAQEMLQKNRREYERPAKYPYLCQSLIKCVRCGRRYTMGILKPKPHITYLRYICTQAYRGRVNEPPCHARTMSVRKLDTYVWEYLKGLIREPEKVKKHIRILRERQDRERTFAQNVYSALMVEKTKIQQRKDRLLDLYSDGSIMKEDLDRKIENLNNEQSEIERQLKDAQQDLEKIEKISTIEEEVDKVCLEYQNKLPKMNFEMKKKFVKMCIKEIKILDNGDIKIKVKIPPLQAVQAEPEKTKVLAKPVQFCPSPSIMSEDMQHIKSPPAYPTIKLIAGVKKP